MHVHIVAGSGSCTMNTTNMYHNNYRFHVREEEEEENVGRRREEERGVVACRGF